MTAAVLTTLLTVLKDSDVNSEAWCPSLAATQLTDPDVLRAATQEPLAAFKHAPVLPSSQPSPQSVRLLTSVQSENQFEP